MKIKTFFILASCILHFQSIMGQWEWQNPLPQGNSLNDVFFFNHQIGWAVGNAGTIIKSEDGGLTYDVVNFPTQSNLVSVEFFMLKNGLAIGECGIILITTNGGLKWSKKEAGFTENLTDLCLVNPGNAWIAGAEGTILHSDDYGETWQSQFCDTSVSLKSICFVDSLNGWAAGGNNSDQSVLLHTVNGGLTWTEISDGILEPLSVVCFTDTQDGWAIISADAYKTVDGGNSWSLNLESIFVDKFLDIYFTDPEHGWISGYYAWTPIPRSLMLYTDDGGITWYTYTNPYYCWLPISSVFYIDAEIGWAVGDAGTILNSTNGGQDWSVIYNSWGSVIFMDIFFVDPSNGWTAGCWNGIPVYGKLMHTGDGGLSWTDHYGDFTILYSIFFTDQLEGWVVGNWISSIHYNIVLHTTDGGNTWERQFLQQAILYPVEFSDVWFIDSEHGWVVGGETNINSSMDHPILLSTSNGGANWQGHSNVTDKSLSAICFVDDYSGWISGFNTILHTTDGGQNWEEQWSGNCNLTDICFIDEDHGWALGDNLDTLPLRDIVMRTTDGGVSWETHFFDHRSPGKKIFFSDIYRGWIARDDGIYYTDDGGINWEPQIINAVSLSGVYFVDNECGWVSGNNSAILHTENGGMVGAKEPAITQNSKLRIQNYPNPFSNETNIEFTLPEDRQVTLKVYDLTGREIETLVSGRLEQGDHTYILHSTNMQSGLYLYRLLAGDEMVTGKMVVRKK